MKIDEKILSKLTEDQKKKVEAAQTPEELLALAKDYGYTLSDEQLDALIGGHGDRICNDTDWCSQNTCNWYW